MSLDAGGGPSRGGSGQDLWPKWMWIAVPVLVVVVVAGLWWALLSPPDSTTPEPTPTPTKRFLSPQPTQGPTVQPTAPAGEETVPTAELMPELPTFTPTIIAPVATPTGQPTDAPLQTLAVGANATTSAGSGLNVRAGAGTGQPRVKTLPMGSIVEVIGGPKEANGYVWWEIRDAAGITGWAVEEYLQVKK